MGWLESKRLQPWCRCSWVRSLQSVDLPPHGGEIIELQLVLVEWLRRGKLGDSAVERVHCVTMRRQVGDRSLKVPIGHAHESQVRPQLIPKAEVQARHSWNCERSAAEWTEIPLAFRLPHPMFRERHFSCWAYHRLGTYKCRLGFSQDRKVFSVRMLRIAVYWETKICPPVL